MAWKSFPLAFAGILVVALTGSGEPQIVTLDARSASAAVRQTFGSLPLYFAENRGQVDSRVAYYVQGRDTTLYFTPDGLTIALTDSRSPSSALNYERRRRWTVALDFVGANPDVRVRGQDLGPAVISYFKGPREQWKAGLRTYASLVYPNLWPGIDLVFTGTVNRLKYTFLIQPGADPERIKLAYRGATAVALTGAGELDVSTPVSSFRDERPYAYQEVEGRQVEVAAAYALGRQAAAGVYDYSFKLGRYDRSKALVLDPAMLVYAGYIGGTGSDMVQGGIAVDSAGDAYVTGYTDSSQASFPVTVGPDLTYNGGDIDAFIAKVNAAGTALIYAGYIGGAGNDVGSGIAVDSSGNAYVGGSTSSTAATFPVTIGPDLTYNGGDSDGFVAKVNPSGTGLVYAGYIGGIGGDAVFGIVVDTEGNAYVSGPTFSSEATFPVTVGPDLTFNGNIDAFVAKVNAAGTALTYCGYIGGSGDDRAGRIAVDGAGNAYVTGFADSSEATFPEIVGPDVTFNGVRDAFVVKVNALGTGFVYAGYIGGAGFDQGHDIAVDSAGNAYVTGFTSSTEATFPVTGGPDLTYNGGTFDAYVAKVNALGTALLYAGYIGGVDFDSGNGIAVDSGGNSYVTGTTNSTEVSFPATGGPDLTYNGGAFDAFVAKVNAAGTAPVYAGYVGGAGLDQGFGIAVDSAGSAYVVGETGSSETTFPVTVGPDLTYNGGSSDAFVVKISEFGAPATLMLDPPADTNPVGTSHTVTATVSDASGNPVEGVIVRFTVTGSVTASGECTTDANGQCSFTYDGPPLPGDDAISAYADTDNDDTQDVGEPSGAATKAWVLPVTTPLCEITITNGGRITAANGDKATFGGNARSDADSNTQGDEEYRDHGPAQPLNVHSINVLAIVCDGLGEEASIYGQATIDGAGSFFYRIKVKDLAESGIGQDTYWILLQTGYTSGEQTLEGGNVQISKQ